MKILAITCGRKNGNTDILAKNVLMGALAEDADTQVELVRLQELNIKHCTGCEGCMKRMIAGQPGKCVITGDDMEWLGNKIIEADGYVMTAPIYDLMPPGIFISFLNRGLGFNAAHRQDVHAKPRYGTAIALGGSDWVNLGIPMVEFTLRHYGGQDMTVVDCMSVPFVPAKAAILLDEEPLERARAAGRNMVRAYRGEHVECRRDQLKQTEEKYANLLLHGFSPAKPMCPDCGSYLFESRGGIKGACVICDSTGIFAIEDGELKFIPDQEATAMNRHTPAGSKDHLRLISTGHKKAAGGSAYINEQLRTVYKEFDPVVRP